MTSNEILKADMLDIVFENRNKKYGAYLLRKYYNNRLAIGISGMFAFVLLLFLIISFNPAARNAIASTIGWRDTVTVSLPPPPVEPPPAAPPQQRVRQVLSSNRIEIVNEPTNMHTQDEIENALPSTSDVDGIIPNGTASPVTESPSIQQPMDPPSEPPPLPTSAASFPGGQQAWMAFLNRYLHTPDELEKEKKKTVLVRFSVGADGSISQFEIMKSGGEAFDNEVIRVLKKMPKWKPAVQNGHNVTAMFTQPVTFMAYEE